MSATGNATISVVNTALLRSQGSTQDLLVVTHMMLEYAGSHSRQSKIESKFELLFHNNIPVTVTIISTVLDIKF